MADSVLHPVRSVTMPDADQTRDRLQRLEEAQGLADHAAAQLAEEVRALSRRLAELQAQVRRLESHLTRLSAPPPSEERSEQD
jgi:septal ring factor EnvC (AmiA/AmiB activator)